MVDELEPGDQLELPGPIGGYLVWARALASPMLVVSGGSGVVPLRAMLRHHVAAHSPATMRLLYSARSPRDLVYGQELSRLADVDPGVDVQLTFTQHWPANWNGHRGRIDRWPLGRIRPGRRRSDR